MEAIKVNLIPNGIPEACHASQYDEGRQIRLDLFDGLTPYTIQAGDTFTLNVRKPDNHVITQTVTGTEGNTYLVIETSEQMTAVTGENLCEIRLENDGDNIGSLNFIMQVEKDVIANGIPSESVIEDLEALVVEAVGDNYYTKTETDELLSQKADVTDLLDLLPTDNASGAVANFTDGADNVPVKALSVEFAASQASGTPTPSSPIPITPVSSIKVTRTGKNLIEGIDNNILGLSNNIITYASGTGTIIKARLVAGQSYIISGVTKNRGIVAYFDEMPQLNATTSKYQSFGNTSYTFTADYSGFALIYIANSVIDTTSAQLEFGSIATAYEAYNGVTKTLALGGDYYGGEVDKDGNIDDNKDKIVIDGSQTITVAVQAYIKSDACDCFITVNDIYPRVSPPNQADGFAMCDKLLPVKQMMWNLTGYPNCMTINQNQIHLNIANNLLGITDYTQETTATAKAKMQTFLQNNPITVIFSKAPATAQASNAIELNTLLGDNNFFSDAGDVDVTIRADIALYIQKMLGGNVNRSLGANPSILRTGAISTDIEVREPVEPDSEPVELEREVTEQPENEGNDNEER